MSLTVQFLTEIRRHLVVLDGARLRDCLRVSQPAAASAGDAQYGALAQELRSQLGSGAGADARLDALVERCLPEDDDVADGRATPWPGFVTLVRDYLGFLRDAAGADDPLLAHDGLSSLVNSCGTAFSHPTYGGVLLQTSIALCEALARLTLALSRRPDLQRRRGRRAGGGDPEDGRSSVAETSAEIIQRIFTTCLTDRSSPRNARPDGKKTGIYMFANLVLKLLFACSRTHLAGKIFTNISTNSPPLLLYPASQRVTFLYYLGRFHFANNHFLWAAVCLDAAYLQTPAAFVAHRSAILTYLIPCNLVLGRLPAAALLQRPEAAAAGLVAVFGPLALAVRTGNFLLFHHALAAHQPWLLRRGLLLTLTYRLRPLLWRSLSRRTFQLTYRPAADPLRTRAAATLELSHLLTVATYLQRRLEGWQPSTAPEPRARPSHVSTVFMQAVRNNTSADATSTTTLVPPRAAPHRLRPNEGLVSGQLAPTLRGVEATVAALVHQGLLHGFVAHSQGRFAVMGSKQRGGPVAAGWPPVFASVMDRRYDEDVDWTVVPGWVTA